MGRWLATLLLLTGAPAQAQRFAARAPLKTAPITVLPAPQLSLGASLSVPSLFPGLHKIPTIAPLALPAHSAPLEAERLILPAKAAPAKAEKVVAASKKKTAFSERIRQAVKAWTPAAEGQGKSKDFTLKLEAGFDGRDSLSRYLREDWEMPVAAAPAARYRAALQAAAYSVEGERESELADAAAEFARRAGIAVERRSFEIAGRSFEGFRVVPVAGVSRLNEIARRAREELGADMDFVPGRTQGASAMFNTEEGRLYLPEFGHEDSYAAILHELRHAYYTALKKKGQTRLFHMAVLPVGRHKVAPQAWGYSKYLSLEELSTYPKTLRHLLALARGQKTPELRRRVISSLITRTLQYHEILNSAAYNMDFAQRRRAGNYIEAQPLDTESLRSRQLGIPPGGRQYAARLPHAWLYFPVETEPEQNLWRRWFGRKDAHALAVFDLKVELLRELIAENGPVLEELMALLNKESADTAALQILANRLVVQTQKKDEDFVYRYAALRAAR